MQILFLLIPISIVFGAAALWAFFWCLKTDQYDDLDGAAERILLDSDVKQK